MKKKAVYYSPPKLDRTIMVHGHCHQKAIVGMNEEASILKKMGANTNLLDSGCCGMAGSFGFEEHKYDISKKVFEHELRGHVEAAPEDTILMANGFSCKTQIEQSTGRQALHMAQIIKIAIDKNACAVAGDSDARGYMKLRRNNRYRREWITGAIAVSLCVGAGLLFRLLRNRRFGNEIDNDRN